ncbi:MAG: hypothetical protein WC297_02315 [Candidatus Paceibacterota bacterium]|jgi:hypothetical protein
MNFKKTKNIFILSIIFLSLLSLVCFISVKAAEQTTGQTSVGQTFSFPWSNATGLGALIKQIYLITLGLVGVLALGIIVFGGIQYSMSAGDPTRQKDARDRITQALWGVILLLAAFLILNTINPDLIKLEEPSFGTIITASSTGELIDTTNPATSLTEQQIRSKLASWGITVWESCPGCTKVSCLRQNTINELGDLAKHCQNAIHHGTQDCPITLTGGCEQTGHAQGVYSHANGYKVDLQPATAGSDLSTYILNNCAKLSGTSSVYKERYRCSSGAIYNLESQTNGGFHWDVVIP